MASLWQINEDLERVISGSLVFDEETGEVLFDADNLNELEAAFNDKVEACALFIKNLDADAAAIKAEEAALAERRKVMERKAERMRAYVLDVLQDKVESHKFSTPKVELSLRKSERVVISDQNALGADYMTVKTTSTPNKTAIKNAIKAGIEVEGAALVECQNLQVK